MNLKAQPIKILKYSKNTYLSDVLPKYLRRGKSLDFIVFVQFIGCVEATIDCLANILVRSAKDCVNTNKWGVCYTKKS